MTLITASDKELQELFRDATRLGSNGLAAEIAEEIFRRKASTKGADGGKRL